MNIEKALNLPQRRKNSHQQHLQTLNLSVVFDLLDAKGMLSVTLAKN